MPQGTTHGKTYKVTTLVDENDGGNGGTGLSLREAIAQANANPGTDKIRFKASLKNGTIVLEGKLDITDGLKIDGLGADALTVSGNNQSSIFAITANTTIEGLNITEGQATTDSVAGESAIYNSANLTLQDSIVTGNTQSSSGSGTAPAIYNQGELTLVQSTVSGNGVGIQNEQGTLTIQRSTIADNSTAGIYTYLGETLISDTTISGSPTGISSSYEIVVIDNSTITGNGTGVEGSAQITNTKVVGNSIGLFGEFVEVNNSTISDHSATGLYGQTVTLLNSTVADNGGNGLEGGYFGPVTIVNSTISGNGGSGIDLSRGYGYDAPVNIFNSTITNNAISGSGHGISVDFEFAQYTDPLAIGNSIIAGNSGGADISAIVSSQGNNLIGNGDDATGFTNGINGDQVGTAIAPINPLLGPLQNNGGPTKTHELLSESSAIDAGNNAIIPSEIVTGPFFSVVVDTSTDQRGPGFKRIVNNIVDIGAFEVQSGVVPPEPPTPGETIVGTDGKDKLEGTSANDRIEGLAGNDQINGKAGDDIIVGGLGKDSVTGGIGSDVFTFDSLQDKGDTIRDFEVGADTIDLSALFSASQFDGFSDDVGRFENYVRVRSRSNGVSVEVDQLGDNGTKFVRMAFVKNISVADLSISELKLTA